MTIPLLEITASQCPWIIGEPRGCLCCGQPTEGRTYCTQHATVAYTKSETVHSVKPLPWSVKR